MWRHMLNIAITNNKELSYDNILKLSQKLDEVIVNACKERLNTNNE